MNNLQKILRIQRNELISDFDKASLEGQGTPQEVSDRRENYLHNFFRNYFPYPYQIAKGNISDSFGNRSNSIDILIINPSHPHTLAANNMYSFIVAEGVDYAIELKPSFNNKDEIERALTQIQSVKLLKRATDGLLLRNSLTEEQKLLALEVPGIIFSDKTYSNKRNLIEKIVDFYSRESIPLNLQFDLLCCLDGTFVVNSSKHKHFFLNTDGLIFNDFGDDVLYYLFHFMCNIPESTPRLKKNMLSHYISQPPVEGWKIFQDLNIKLRRIGN
ncbi:MAG: hypothetical protein N4A72_01860 [Bacteroidales bacterium]|jgi:hypothetical protein|nr:hypothetical protein [Bacteroidales bacterium]